MTIHIFPLPSGIHFLEHITVFFKTDLRKQNFVSVVNKALLDTGYLTMDHFALFLSGLYDWSLLDTWFSNIFNRIVKNLQIHSFYKLSFSVFASHSLFKNFLLLEQSEMLADLISLVQFTLVMLPPNLLILET